jgi:hypothetical protein
MEDFKIENFKREYPGRPFPIFRSLSEAETSDVREALGAAAEVAISSDLLAFTRAICARGKTITISASEASFDLCATLGVLGIRPRPRLLVNWYRFDNIDEMELLDLRQYFSDIWYPGVDDIDLFDRTYDWIVSIRHDGQISYAQLRSS